MNRSLSQLQRRAPESLAPLLNENRAISLEAADKLVREAKDYGLCMKDFLTLAINPRLSEKANEFGDLNGFEASLSYLKLPFRNDFENGVHLQAASDNFQTYPGTRAMFPEVVDQMLRFKNRQDMIEKVEPMVAQSRTIAGSEMISTTMDDDSAERGTFIIAEFGNIPVRKVSTSQTSVTMGKRGSGIRTSYEFERRASLDILTPFAARVARELEISKVSAATNILINGDGVNAAATTVGITSFGGTSVATKALSEQYKALARWMVTRAKAGTPINTLVGNLDVYLELLFMFTPTLAGQRSEIEAVAAKGGPMININLPILGGNANFVLSSAMPDDKILGYSKEDTLEELVEAGSTIVENEKSIQNQSVIYVRTETTGYKLAYADTRSILDLTA